MAQICDKRDGTKRLRGGNKAVAQIQNTVGMDGACRLRGEQIKSNMGVRSYEK